MHVWFFYLAIRCPPPPPSPPTINQVDMETDGEDGIVAENDSNLSNSLGSEMIVDDNNSSMINDESVNTTDCQSNFSFLIEILLVIKFFFSVKIL